MNCWLQLFILSLSLSLSPPTPARPIHNIHPMKHHMCFTAKKHLSSFQSCKSMPTVIFSVFKTPNNASLWCDVVVIWISAKSQYYSRANMRNMRFKSYFNQIQIYDYVQSQEVQDRSKMTLFLCMYVCADKILEKLIFWQMIAECKRQQIRCDK